MEAAFSRFAQEHFGGAPLGDARRSKRLVQVAQRVVAHPGGTLPTKMGMPADLKGFYRLMNCAAVTHTAVMQPHRQLTLRRMKECKGVVLLIHDTTQLDYTGKHSLENLGQIAKGFHRGYLCHNTLAVEADSGRAIGLASQILHIRPKIPKNEPRKKRLERADRESRLWKRGSEAVGSPPPGCMWADICDRGGDLFEYLDHKHAQGGWYVVRSKHDRIVWAKGDPKRPVKLHQHARSLETLGTWSIEVSANTDRPALGAGKAGQRQGDAAGAAAQVRRAWRSAAGGVGGARDGDRPAGRRQAAGVGAADQRAGRLVRAGQPACVLVRETADDRGIPQGPEDRLRDRAGAIH